MAFDKERPSPGGSSCASQREGEHVNPKGGVGELIFAIRTADLDRCGRSCEPVRSDVSAPRIGGSQTVRLVRRVTRWQGLCVCLGMKSGCAPNDRWASLVWVVVRCWLPLPMIVGGSLVAQHLVLTSRYDVGGHAAGHLAGASAPFMAAAVVCILVWSTASARREADVLAAASAWLGACVLVLLGNLRVIDDLVAAGYARTPTSVVPDVADHSLANSSVWLAEIAALVLVFAWHRRHHAGGGVTAAAFVFTVVVPPWIIPGAGVIILAAAAVVACAAGDHRWSLSGRSVSGRKPGGRGSVLVGDAKGQHTDARREIAARRSPRAAAEERCVAESPGTQSAS